MSSNRRLQQRIKHAEEAAGQLAPLLESARQSGPHQQPWQQLPFAACNPAQATYWTACYSLLEEVEQFLVNILGTKEATEQVVHGLLARSAAKSAGVVQAWLLQQPEILAAAVTQPQAAQAPMNNEQRVAVQLWAVSLSIVNSMAILVTQLAVTDAGSAAVGMMQQLEASGVWAGVARQLHNSCAGDAFAACTLGCLCQQ
jgi:hypothetical protein